jgi:hypothetical protein
MTLIELLVVIGVILVIMGITYQVLSQARERAHLATCISNLRQLIQAVHMYEQDWGTVPIAPNHPIKTPEGMWGFIDQMLYPYVRDKSVFLCPSDPTRGRWRPELPNLSSITIVWKGEEWLNSYHWLINELVVQIYGKGNPRLKSTSPLFVCSAHKRPLGFSLIAHYDGSIVLWPKGRPRFVRAEFEGEGGENREEEDVLN